MKNTLKISAVALVVLLASGCAKNVSFKSEPSGATVTCDGCRGGGSSDTNTLLGVTPFTAEIKDNVSFYSEYTLTAVKNGFKPTQQKITEKSIIDGTSFDFFPNEVNFKLEK